MKKKWGILLGLIFISLASLAAIIAIVCFDFGKAVWTPKKDKEIEVLVDTQKDSNGYYSTEDFLTEEENFLKGETETELNSKDENRLEDENKLENSETTLLFAGDVLLTATTGNYYDTEGVSRIVSDVLLEEMREADILMVNNEFQFSNRGTPMEDKQYTFRIDPKYVDILLEMGVDIVSLANNHSIDFGTDALEDTFQTLDEAGILYAGAGDTKERAEALQIIEKNGKKFGFLAATRVIPVAEWNIENRQPGLFAAYDDTGLVKCIEAAKEVCDFLAVYVHWGIERNEQPEEYQRVIARHCVEAGADVVIGAHPHVLQGIEFINDKPVFYSLGNYIFNHTIAKTMLVKVVISADGEVSYQLVPAYAADGRTQPATEEQAKKLFSYLNEISGAEHVDYEGRIFN